MMPDAPHRCRDGEQFVEGNFDTRGRGDCLTGRPAKEASASAACVQRDAELRPGPWAASWPLLISTRVMVPATDPQVRTFFSQRMSVIGHSLGLTMTNLTSVSCQPIRLYRGQRTVHDYAHEIRLKG